MTAEKFNLYTSTNEDYASHKLYLLWQTAEAQHKAKMNNYLYNYRREESAQLTRSQLSLVRKYLNSLYSFSPEEFETCFGKDAKFLIENRFFIWSDKDLCFYCEQSMLQQLLDTRLDLALFYSNISKAYLVSIFNSDFNKLSKVKIITYLIRTNKELFPQVYNPDKEVFQELLQACDYYGVFLNAQRLYDPISNGDRQTKFCHLNQYQLDRFLHGEEGHSDVLKFFSRKTINLSVACWEYSKVFSLGMILAFTDSNQGVAIALHPYLRKLILEYNQKTTKEALQAKLGSLQPYLANPGAVSYHESLDYLDRVTILLFAQTQNKSISRTTQGSLKVSELKNFWKKILGRVLYYNETDYYLSFANSIEFLSESYVNKDKKKRFELLRKHFGLADDEKRFNHIPKDQWISFDDLNYLNYLQQIILNSHVIIGKIKNTSELDNASDSMEASYFNLLESHRLLYGHVDFETSIENIKGNKYKKIVALKLLATKDLDQVEDSNAEVVMYLENNFSVTIPPNLPSQRLYALAQILSVQGPNTLILDEAAIVSFKQNMQTAPMAQKILEDLLQSKLSPVILDFLNRNLGDTIQLSYVVSFSTCIYLTDAKQLSKLKALFVDVIEKVIDDRLIVFKSHYSSALILNKLRSNKIAYEQVS